MSAEFKGWCALADSAVGYHLRRDYASYDERFEEEAWLKGGEATGTYSAQHVSSDIDGSWAVYCFSDRETALRFKERFGGYDPRGAAQTHDGWG